MEPDRDDGDRDPTDATPGSSVAGTEGPDLAHLDLDVPPTRVIDASGLACPMPVIELAKGIDEVAEGEVIVLLATDPAAGVDVPVWCRMRRQRLRHREDRAGTWIFAVQRVG